MEKGATDSKYIIDGSGCAEHGIVAGKVLLPVAVATKQVKDNRVNTVCKADLISIANREETRKSVALIDRLLSQYRLAEV